MKYFLLFICLALVAARNAPVPRETNCGTIVLDENFHVEHEGENMIVITPTKQYPKEKNRIEKRKTKKRKKGKERERRRREGGKGEEEA